MKKMICFLLAVCLVFALTGCIKTKTLHCDYCQKEITVKENSNMNEEWIVYCEECNEELFGDDPVLGNG